MVWLYVILSLLLTIYFFLSAWILVSLSFSFMNLFFVGMLKVLHYLPPEKPLLPLFLQVYISSSLFFIFSLVVHHYFLKGRVSDEGAVYLQILNLAVCLCVSYKISQLR